MTTPPKRAGLQHLDAVQPSRLRCLPRDRDVALVQLDQPGAHHDAWLRARARGRWGHAEPDGDEEAQDPVLGG